MENLEEQGSQNQSNKSNSINNEKENTTEIKEAPNIEMKDEDQADQLSEDVSSSNGPTMEEKVQNGENKHNVCSSSSSSLPTHIRGQPGLQLVVDLSKYDLHCAIGDPEENASEQIENAVFPHNGTGRMS
ncbi:hypothetical protein A4A49_08128 [Nicotiana attenuata]|uniref:Uncharacterized protein n=1 Tax=Nicotiana attenuata TaxID=49451 RepID=A0A1J6IE95_NICAT|nr:hypothetical protein A4A49_08128 [Nicotiana attenuata]